VRLEQRGDVVARQRLGDAALASDALAFHHRSEYALQANWKVVVENFLEYYHCAIAHPGFSDVIDVDEKAYRLETHPTFASHYARVRERPRGVALRRVARPRRPAPPRGRR
jgi:phenylpropionate dioxygenase-like ring-hydroxylating dioxygenase large terminal subunit